MRRSNSCRFIVFNVEMTSATGEDEVVAELLSVPFSRRQFSEKTDIIMPRRGGGEAAAAAAAGGVCVYRRSSCDRYGSPLL